MIWRLQRSVRRWQDAGLLDSVVAVQVDLYGSLAKTGRGHMTDMAVMLGLSDEDPVTCRTGGADRGKSETDRRCQLLRLRSRSEVQPHPFQQSDEPRV